MLALLQELQKISPSLASMVKVHDPEFVKFEAHSMEWKNHFAGLGATGLSVSPCLVRMGAVGTGTLDFCTCLVIMTMLDGTAFRLHDSWG